MRTFQIVKMQEICGNEYAQYNEADEYGRMLDNALQRQQMMLKDAWMNLTDERIKFGTLQTLRLHVYNTYSNQPSGDPELDSYTPQEWIHRGPPSWTLHIQGAVVGAEGANNPKMTSFFSKILVITSTETIVWDKATADVVDCNGIEIHRQGSKQELVKIVFFMDYKTPHFVLSAPLVSIVGSKQRSLPGIVRALWNYIKNNDLQAHNDPQTIRTNDLLKSILNVDTFNLCDLPELLKEHLSPPLPVTVTHLLKLRGSYLDSESVYDFTVDAPECFPGDAHSWLPAVMNHNAQLASISRSIDDTDRQMAGLMAKLNHCITMRNFYTTFHNSPVETIDVLLTSKGSEPDKPLVDESQLFEYQVADRRSTYYQQPWVPRAIQMYLENRNKSLESRFNKALHSLRYERKRGRDADKGLGANKNRSRLRR